MEAHNEKRLPDGRRRMRRFPIFKFLIQRLGTVLKATGLYRRGLRNAVQVKLNRLEIAFDGLPKAFDGYTILHITDLHVDGLPDGMGHLAELVKGVQVDTCVLTGDYRFNIRGPFDAILPPMGELVDAISARDGIFGILGNHDSVEMVEPFEKLGIRMLANETISLARGGETVHLTGIDDVHYYYTVRALEALRATPDGFNIALVHSPEIVEQAASAGISLYLTGHTHGGQICLPGGVPILTNIAAKRVFATGPWRCGAMMGYTSPGAGISGLPVRYFSKSEAALITLRRRA
jgi:predicted MPP superfamily phosphohydrolase